MKSSACDAVLDETLAMTKVSVLVPSYNHAEHIGALLESLAVDTYADKEVIILDDGSTDGTPESVRAWLSDDDRELQVRLLTRENRGVSATLNELAEMATGEYLAFIASDDYLLQDSIAIRAGYLDEHDDVNAVFGDCKVVDGGDALLHESGLEGLYGVNKSLYNTKCGLKKQIITRWSVPGGTLMARKSVFDTVRFDEDHLMEDRGFYLQMVALDWLAFIDRPLAAYRIHGNNVSRTGEHRYRMAKDSLLILFHGMRFFGTMDRLLFIVPLIRSLLLVMIRGARRFLCG